MRWCFPFVVAAACAFVACGDDPDGTGSGRRSGTSTSSSSSSGDDGSSSGDPASSSGGADDGTAAQVCVDSINGYRKQMGLAPYERWTAQESCADGQAKSDATTSNAHGAFGKCSETGQNECPGWAGPAATMIPQCLKAMWGEGPGGGHHDAMASTRYKRVACGFGAAANGKIWAVQNFQ